MRARDAQGPPRRYQVTEVPPGAAHITEYRCHRRVCPGCGTTTVAALPDEGTGQFGPHLTALIAYFTVVCRLPRAVVQGVLEGVLQIPISVGSTQAAWEEASVAVAAPYTELRQALPQQPVVNVDETGHRTNGDKRWLWTVVARTFVAFTITASRARTCSPIWSAPRLWPSWTVIRLPTHPKYAAAHRQLCWSHYADLRIMPTRVRARRLTAVRGAPRSA